MLSWPPVLLGALSLSITSWSSVARAQTDATPSPDAPSAEPAPPSDVAPSEPAPPSDVAPSEPAPPTDVAPPPGSPAAPPESPPPGTAPAVPSGPPSSAFPLPPAPPTGSPPPSPTSPPASAPAAAPRPVAEPVTPAPAPERPRRPTEGLFEERPGAPPVHHHRGESEKEGTDQFKIGPVVGVGVPSVLSFGGTLKVTRFFGAGINIGLIPKVKLSYYGDATLSYQHYDIYGRIYPFGGGFFLSGGAGYATVRGTLDGSETRSISGISGTVDYQGEGSVRTLMLTALIGYFHTTSIGFSIGVDAGAQIPLAPSQIEFSRTYDVRTGGVTLSPAQIDSLAGPYITKSDKSVVDSLERIGRTVLPTLNLRIGWIL